MDGNKYWCVWTNSEKIIKNEPKPGNLTLQRESKKGPTLKINTGKIKMYFKMKMCL